MGPLKTWPAPEYTMSKIDEILPVQTMSWTRAIGSYIFATICGGAIGVAVREPDFNIV